MFESVLKFSRYYEDTKWSPSLCKMDINDKRCSESSVINKAFNSLSFRGKRGYRMNLCGSGSGSNKLYNRVEVYKHNTYGGIVCVKDEMCVKGDLYALVQGRYTGKWSFPKGHSNKGEKPIECALREVGEETGIDTLPEPLEYLQIGYGNYFVFNLEEQIELNARDMNEIIDTRWVTLEEMEGLSLNADANLYRKYLVNKSNVNVNENVNV